MSDPEIASHFPKKRRIRFPTIETAVIYIQKIYRGWSFNREYQLRNVAATRIQGFIRGCLSRKRVLTDYLSKKGHPFNYIFNQINLSKHLTPQAHSTFLDLPPFNWGMIGGKSPPLSRFSQLEMDSRDIYVGSWNKKKTMR